MKMILHLTLSVLFAVLPNPTASRVLDYREMLDEDKPNNWQVKGFDLPGGFFIIGRQLTCAGDFLYRIETWDTSHEMDSIESKLAA